MSGPSPTIDLNTCPELADGPNSDCSDEASPQAAIGLTTDDRTSGGRKLARVLHVINGEHYSGAERVQDLLALRLPECGYQADLAALVAGKFGDVRRSLDARLTELNMTSRFDFRVVGQIKKLVRKHEYQLLHAHTPRTAMISALAARSLGLPWVYHVHSPVSRDSGRNLQNKINGFVERVCLSTASKVIVVSPSLLPYMRERGVGDDRLVCVPNGVPVSENPRPPRPAGEPLVVGMVALFRPRKGTEVLLESLANLISRGHRVQVNLIGGFETPEYEQQIRDLADHLGVADNIDFVGFTSDVPSELTKLDVMVLPSLYGEGLPMVVLEAMSAGVPVVASNVEGASAAIEHRQSGLLTEPGSVSQLATSIERFVTGEIDHAQMASAAKERHRQLFSDLAMSLGVADVYSSLLVGRQ